MKRLFLTTGLFLLLTTGTSIARTVTYSYDSVGKLTSITYDNGITVLYSYDALGNRLGKTVTIPPTLDTDGDTVPDLQDGCPFDPNDTIGNPCKHDDDGDGIGDTDDTCPFDRNHDGSGDPCNHLDCPDRSPQDGVADPCNHDDDQDGVPDNLDLYPLNASESADTDGDRIGNNADLDDDNDTVPDSLDRYPLESNRPPSLEPVGTQVVLEGEWVRLLLHAFDPDDDPLAFELLGGPEGSKLADDGTYIWKAPWKGEPEEKVSVRVTDGLLTDEIDFMVVARDENAPPEVGDFLAIPYEDRIELSWTLPAGEDLAGVMLTRNDRTSEGEPQVADVGMNETFVDREVKPGHRYDYQMSTYDEMKRQSKGVPSSPPEVTVPEKLIEDEQALGGGVTSEGLEPAPAASTPGGMPYQFVGIGGCTLTGARVAARPSSPFGRSSPTSGEVSSTPPW